MKKPKKELTREEAWGWNELLVICAFRYCLGRQTYVVKACADWIVDNWDKFLPIHKQIIERELEREFELDNEARAAGDNYKPLGWDCDRQDWERVRALWSKSDDKTT